MAPFRAAFVQFSSTNIPEGLVQPCRVFQGYLRPICTQKCLPSPQQTPEPRYRGREIKDSDKDQVLAVHFLKIKLL
jgi:hypothetical protein